MLRVARAFRPIFGTLQPRQYSLGTAIYVDGKKTTTGLTGLKVDPNGRANLIALSKQILEEMKDIPEEAGYRIAVEKFTNFRLKCAEENETIEAIEAAVGKGQVEELIEQAKDELDIIPMMKEHKPWEVPEGHQVELIINGRKVDP